MRLEILRPHVSLGPLTVCLPQLVQNVIVDSVIGHQGAHELLERGEFGQGRSKCESAGSGRISQAREGQDAAVTDEIMFLVMRLTLSTGLRSRSGSK